MADNKEEKKLIYVYHTLGTIYDLKDKVSLIYKIVDVVVQILFLAFYAYLIYSNTSRLAYLIVYSIIATISLGYFIFRVITINNENHIFNTEIKPKVKYTIKVFKYILRITAMVFVFIEIAKYGITDFQKIITGGSITALVIDIVMLLLTIFISHYVDMFVMSVQMDFESSTLPVWKELKDNPTAKFYEAIDKPLGYIANKKTGKVAETKDIEYTKHQEKLREKIKANASVLSSNAKIDRGIKKKEEKKKVIDHIKTIFGKKK